MDLSEKSGPSKVRSSFPTKEGKENGGSISAVKDFMEEAIYSHKQEALFISIVV